MTNNGGGALVKQTHPIRGLLWGIPFGLGLAVVLVVTGVIPLELSQMVVVAVLGMAIGAAWGLFGPAKGSKGSSPAGPSPTKSAPMGETDPTPEDSSPASEANPEPGADEI